MTAINNTVLELPFKQIQDMIICPLSKQIFKEPVMASDGHIYEKHMIEKWIKTNKTSPITREAIVNKFTNVHFIKQLVANFLIKNPEMKMDQFEPEISFTDLLATKKDISLETLKKIKYFSYLEFLELFDIYIGVSKSLIITSMNKVFVDVFHNFEQMKYIIDNVDNIYGVDSSGWSVAHCIAFHSTDDIYTYMVSKITNIDLFNAKTNNGSMILSLAMWNSLITAKSLEITVIKTTDLVAAYNRILTRTFNSIGEFNEKLQVLISHTPVTMVIDFFCFVIKLDNTELIIKTIACYPKESYNSLPLFFKCNETVLLKILELPDIKISSDDRNKKLCELLNANKNIPAKVIEYIHTNKLLPLDTYIDIYIKKCYEHKKFAELFVDLLSNDILFTKYFHTIIFIINDKDMFNKYIVNALRLKLQLNAIIDPYENNLLHHSVILNDKDTVDILLKHCIFDLNSANNKGYNLLYLSVIYSDIDMLNKFINYIANPFDKSPKCSYSLLHMATKFNKTDMISLFINHGIDINTLTDKKESALHIAAGCAEIKTIKFLLEHGIMTNILDCNGKAYFHYLCNNKNIDYDKIIQKGFFTVHCT